LPRLSIQRVAIGQPCDVSRLAAFLRLRITTLYHRVSCKYSRSVRLSASGSSRSPAESRFRRTNWSISTSRNSINKQRSPLRRRARYRCIRRAAAERVDSIVGGDVSAVSRSWTISAPVEGAKLLPPHERKISRPRSGGNRINDLAPDWAIGLAGRLTGPVGLPLRARWEYPVFCAFRPAGVDVKRTLSVVQCMSQLGPRADLKGMPREGPDSAR
jgi:hypothetical protein